MLEMPGAIDHTFIPTFNKMGYMTTVLDPYSNEFIQYVTEKKVNCLDVGAAYGLATIPALKGGATVIANDIDERHLEILKNNTPLELQKNLQLLPGKFPDEIDLLPGSIDAALICRVMHYFPPEAIIESANKLFAFLKPNGKVFIVAETPYNPITLPCMPIYEERKKQNNLWPGFFENPKQYFAEKFRENQPEAIHLLDPDVMSRVFKEAGFVVEQCDFFARKNWPKETQYDGRESMGLIARKPKK